MNIYFPDSDSSSDLDDSTLPFPTALPRSAFLTPDFDPATFLSSLHNRHQTLEDLRSELRTRSQDLNKELLDLVNENYQDFIGLGSSLHGGEEKVEEVRLGLLGFQRDVEGLKGKVEGRRREVEELLQERKRIKEEVQMGRGLLEVERRLEELEERLMVGSNSGGQETAEDEDEIGVSDSEDESDEDIPNAISTSKLVKHAQQYVYITRMVTKIGPEHPFVVKQEGRILRVKQTVLLDLSSALKQAITDKAQNRMKDRLLAILGVYRDMEEFTEASRILRDQATQG